MIAGSAFALSEITLVIFTTLTPAAVLAVLGLVCLVLKNGSSTPDAKKLLNFMVLPLGLASIGFLMSATHLGDPSNVLYVFSGIGRSPLSNEVLFAALFMALAGLLWVYSFKENLSKRLVVVWCIVVVLSGLAFMAFMATAYSAKTIITWNIAITPLSILLGAFSAGPLVLALCLTVANESKLLAPRINWALSIGGTVCVIIIYLWLAALLPDYSNQLFTASELAPSYSIMVAASIVFSCVAEFLADRALRASSRKTIIVLQGLACVLIYLSIFFMRFEFYAIHMTIGLGA